MCIDFFWIASVAASLMLASLLIGGGAFSTFLVWYSDLDTCVTIGLDLLLNCGGGSGLSFIVLPTICA